MKLVVREMWMISVVEGMWMISAAVGIMVIAEVRRIVGMVRTVQISYEKTGC